MRKLTAIFFILILLFNIGGYRLAISMLKQNADQRLETRLDQQQYNESQLIEIRVALNMPYQERFTEFERHYGEIEMDGKTYTYVSKKIAGDVVVFKCIANESRQHFNKIQDELARAGSDSNPAHQKELSFAKNFWSEYVEQYRPLMNMSFDLLENQRLGGYSFFIPQTDLTTPHQPPELA